MQEIRRFCRSYRIFRGDHVNGSEPLIGMSDPTTALNVLERYPIASPHSVESLGGAGGFSGAAFWKVKSGDSTLCLRRWPREHPSQDRLKEIHRLLCRVSDRGFKKVPTPLRCTDGETFVSVAGHFWELTRWLPGRADFHEHPTSAKLDAALIALAQFHQHAEPPPTPDRVAPDRVAPGIESRRQQLAGLSRRAVAEMSRAVFEMDWVDFQWRASLILTSAEKHVSDVESLLDTANRFRVPLQPCIRDIWHDHVLFEGAEVSGMVDFGAMQLDHVACDVSRLLGSLVGSDQTKWRQGLAAYQTVRRLSENELVLVEAYDRSTVLLSGLNWVRWIAVERREFADDERVFERMDHIFMRLLQM